MRRIRKCLTGTCLAVVLMALPTPGYGLNGGRIIGVGPRARGMGGVSIALPQDSYVGASNPAGLSRICDRVDIGFDFVSTSGDLDFVSQISEEEFASVRAKSSDDFWYFEGAFSYEVGDCQTLGFAVVPFGGYKAEFSSIPLFEEFSLPEVGSQLRSYMVVPSWSWQWNSCHSVGLAVNFAFAWLDGKGAQFLDDENRSLYNHYVTNRGTDYEGGVGVSFGWLGQLTDDLMVGFIYHSPVWMNLHKNYKGIIPDAGRIDLPAVWGAGLTWCICPTIVASVDLEYIQWSDIPFYGHDLRNQGPLGSLDGPSIGWRNQTVVKLGAAWDLSECLSVRAGYNYGATPIKSKDTVANIRNLMAQESHLTLGATWYMTDGCSELNLALVHAFPNTIRGGVRLVGIQLPIDAQITGEDTSVSLSYGRYF
jgi:long-chain fatty acid transport protein